jgi:hypothetical protein
VADALVQFFVDHEAMFSGLPAAAGD